MPVRCSRRFALRTGAAAVLAGVALSAAQTSSSAADAVFAQFFDARSADEQAAAIDRIVSAGIGVDEAADRLRRGRTYARDAARGAVERSYRSAAGEYFYTLDVPHTYDPAHRYQVADLCPSICVERRTVVEPAPTRKPSRDPRRREAHLQRR
ncbi:MAG: hypothetical protein JF610_10400 [Acidobacteria bacterium]|nr:hypothetical protein [Acidobacteriota bacterium]